MSRHKAPPRREILVLSLLFGTIYFVQGIGEPTEGLIAQPVRSMLARWGYTTGDVAKFAGLLALPWSLKPLFGLITDSLPLAGSRRRSYLILSTALTVGGLLFVYFHPPATGAYSHLLVLLLIPTFGVAFSDVVTDALMVEKGQPRGLTGQLQSVQWTAMYAGTIVTGLVGGWLSQNGRADLGFLICGGVTTLALLLAIFVVRDEPHCTTRQSLRGTWGALARAVRDPGLLSVLAFLFLWNFNPFSSSVLQLYMTRDLGFEEQFYGNSVAVLAVACAVASMAYGFYGRRVPFHILIHVSIVTGIASTLAYWFLTSERSAMVVTVAVGLTYMTAQMIQFDLAARCCPPAAAGTVFALMMATTNFSFSLSTAWGGSLFDRWAEQSDSQSAFRSLVALGAAFTAGCWLLVPWLRKAALRGIRPE